MEIALCIVVASYLAFAFRDVQSFLYIAAVAYMLRMFINNPRLFSNGSPTTLPHLTTADTTAPFDQQAPVAPSHKQLSPPSTQTPTPPAATMSITSTPSSQPTARTVQRKPSRYSFDPINGGVVHYPFGSPKQPTSRTLPSSPSGLRRSHRIPDVSAGRSPILPVQSVTPDSYLPNAQHESYPVAQAEVVNRVVHTEMVAKPKLALETEQALPAKRSPHHRRVGSHHHSRHHHSNSHSYHRRRISRSPMSFSDATAADQDYDSDSSHASSSCTRSSISSLESCGLPSYEKHYTMIVTLCPKRAGYLPQIQSIIKAVRPYWLSLPGSVSHEVGHDSEAGTIVIVETYESKDDVVTFEQSKEREKMLARIKPFIEESKTTTIRLPASSAATRYR